MADIAAGTIAVYKYDLPTLKESTIHFLTLLAKLRQLTRGVEPQFYSVLSILTEPCSIFLSI